MSVLRTLCAPRRVAVLLALLGIALFALPGRADAHVALASSEPTNGASVASLERVTLTFTKTFELVSPGIQLLDAAGKVVPTTLRTEGMTATLTPQQPLASGQYGVRWSAKSPDSHPRSGSVTFAVTGGAAATGEATTTTKLSAALRQKSSTPFALVGDLGRIVAYSGVMLVIGALALGFFVARASAREARWAVLTAQRAALLIGIGTLFIVFAQVSLYAGPGIPWPWKLGAWSDAFFSMWGLSIVCLLGATALFVRAPRPRFAETDTWLRTPAAVGAVGGIDDVAADPIRDPFVAGRLDWRTATPFFVALGLLVFGLAFNGHSQSSSPLLLAWIANIVHVLAAGVWSGGVVLLLALIARRRRAKNPALVVDAPLQFSQVATVASIAAGLTGVLLAAVELPSVGALFSSSFGRILLVKMLVVAAIAGIGAYHHFRLLPALHADPSAARATATWKLLRIEALGFALVIVLTAFLANASYN